MSSEFQREYLLRLPLPLAQLYGRAFNAKNGRSRHDNCFYLFEALIKLGGCVLIAAYADDVRRTRKRNEDLDKLLAQLSLPSLGQWVGFLRELARHFGNRSDAALHPVGHLWEQLNTKRSDLPEALALFRRIKNGPDGKPAGDKSCSILQLIDALVQYRNTVFGHGASRAEEFYDNEMGPLLFPAINDVLAEGSLDLLGRDGSRLVFVREVRRLPDTLVEIGMHELVGLRGERAAPLTLPASESDSVLPDRPAVIWPGRSAPLMLNPLMIYREDELAEDILFLNRDRNGKQVEYLSYTTGKASRDKSMAPDLARLLARLTGRRIDEKRLKELQGGQAEEAIAEFSAGTGDESGLSVAGDYEILAEIGRGGMGIVYLARQLSLGRLVAVKVLPPELMKDEVALARFRREVRALGRCDHPNIVKVVSTGTTPTGQLYYAMEYVPGTNLENAWLEVSQGQRDQSVTDLSALSFTNAVLTASRQTRHAVESTTTGTQASETDSAASLNSIAAFEALGTASMTVDEFNVSEDFTAATDMELLLNREMPLPELDSTWQSDLGQERYTTRIVRLMRDAARALQSVHDQGIIHRDIKPANLVLTSDGERIVLMDFGLAKGSSLTSAATEGGGFLGTLRYAAPEQLAAASMSLGPQVDVRGLGVTMWELLTRRKLFVDAEDEVSLSKCIYERDVPLLRSVDPGFDRDLEAIIVRATERNASDRIQSARQLADLLDLYLDGSPLPIRAPGMAELLWRWVRQHRALVSTAAASSVAIVVTIVVAFVLIMQSRDDEREAKVTAQAAEKEARQAEDKAKQARDEAELARAEAVKRFRQARNAVETSYLEFSDAMRNFPGMQDVQQRMLLLGAEELSRFARDKSDDPELRREAAGARVKLANVQARVGKLEQAIESYQQAETELQKLDGLEDPLAGQLALVEARHGIADAYSLLGQTDKATAAFQVTLKTIDELLTSQADDIALQRLRATTLQSRARTLIETGAARESIELLNQSRDVFQQLAGTTNEAADRQGRATSLNLLCQAQTESGQAEPAVVTASAAITDWSRLVQMDADEPDYLAGRAAANVLLTGALQTLGRDKEQIAASEAAIQDYFDLASALPDVPTFRFNLSLARVNLSQILNRQGANTDALTIAVAAFQELDFLQAMHPQSRSFLAEAAAAQMMLGRIAGELDRQDAVPVFTAALDKFDLLVADFPDFPRYREDRAVCRSNFALVLDRTGETDSAREQFQKAIEELEQLIAEARAQSAGEVPAFLIDAQAHAWNRLGNLLARTGSNVEATKAFIETLELREQLTDSASHLRKLAWFLVTCPDPQFRDHERALTIARQAQQSARDDPSVLQVLALIHYRNDDWDSAVSHARDAAAKRDAPDPIDGFIEAMAQWQAGEASRESARKRFEEAVRQLKEQRPGHPESLRLHAESEELIVASDSSPSSAE